MKDRPVCDSPVSGRFRKKPGEPASYVRRIRILTNPASAPVKAIELSGESPDRGSRYRPVSEGNCVFNRKGGEQLEENEQSVTKVNSIRPSLSGSVLVKREPLTS